MTDQEFALQFIEMRQLMNHLYQKLFHELLQSYHVTQMEIDIILFLANNKQYDTAADLVKKRHLTKSHVSKSIDALVNKGYIIRWQSEDNHKVIHLSLSDTAIPLIEEGRKAQKEFVSIINQGICEEDVRHCSAVIETLMKNALQALKQ